MDRMVQSEEWRDALTRYRWLDRYLSGPAFSDFVDSEEARVQAILRKFNAGRDNPDTLASAGPYPLLVLAGLLVTGIAATFRQDDRRPSHRTRIPRLSSLALLAAGIVLNVFLASPPVSSSRRLRFSGARRVPSTRGVLCATQCSRSPCQSLLICCSRACSSYSCQRVSWDAGSDMVETLEALGHGFSNALTLPHLYGHSPASPWAQPSACFQELVRP